MTEQEKGHKKTLTPQQQKRCLREIRKMLDYIAWRMTALILDLPDEKRAREVIKAQNERKGLKIKNNYTLKDINHWIEQVKKFQQQVADIVVRAEVARGSEDVAFCVQQINELKKEFRQLAEQHKSISLMFFLIRANQVYGPIEPR